VADDGVGLPANAAERSSTGIPGMRERAFLIDARLTIDDAPGGGTRVRLDVPTSGPGEVAT